ncbi:FHA domain-containing protein [Alkalinema sp. FACHB-956]|uniref:protein kinase domain-containing protein n=1 Tax=Alkalinema sp. FACHB-956 TaxID=2692768 RepID=UPI001687B232|nr:protein kinase [Alkalinema sp. FACHB-956]
MITLTLLHPVQSTPVQSWSFEHESIIRVGRSTDNQVILYSAVVSRHHVELRCTNGQWEIVSLGANGTYVDGKRIVRVPIQHGMVFRLARSGPNLQVQIVPTAKPVVTHGAGAEVRSVPPPPPPPLRPIPLPRSEYRPAQESEQSVDQFTRLVDDEGETTESLADETDAKLGEQASSQAVSDDQLFDLTTGKPVKVLQTVGLYQVLKELGRGDTGITYLAWRDGQTVILKTLNGEWLAQPEALKRFEEQSQVLRSLNHPGIPREFDFLTCDRHPYRVMEMVYGQSLADYVTQRGPLPPVEAISCILEVCDILDYLHHQPEPVVHGDIQPKHLIRRSVLRSGQSITLIDWGTVRHLGWKTDRYFSGIGYMAPDFQAHQILPLSDVYALGTTLAFLLSGTDPSQFYSHAEQGYRFYPERVSGLSAEMVNLLRQLTEPNPQDRYQSVREVAQVLRQIL